MRPLLYDMPRLLTKKSSNHPPTLVNPGMIPHIRMMMRPKESSRESNPPFQVGVSVLR
jgi:hypothetical protein